MISLPVLLALTFWIPPAIVIFHNIFWDIRFWQIKEYRIERIYHQIRWDFEPSHRRNWVTIIKIICFILVAVFWFSPGALTVPFAMLISFGVWSNEVFNILGEFLKHRFPYLAPTFRNIAILSIGGTLLGLLPMVLTYTLLNFNPVPSLSTDIVQAFPQVSTSGILVVPIVYVYLVFSTLLALTYDLGSPIISSFLVILTSPIGYLARLLLTFRARRHLQNIHQLVVIAIAGSTGKSTIRELLSQILKDKYRVVQTAHTQTSVSGLATAVLQEVKPGTQVFIAELTSFRPGEISQMGALLQPHIAILTGIDESYVGIFGGKEGLLAEQMSLITHLHARGTAIYNGNDELLAEAAGKSDTREVFYYTSHDPHKNFRENELEINDYYATNIHEDHEQQELTFILHNQSQRLPVTLPLEKRFLVESILAAIATAMEIGVSVEKAIQALSGQYNTPSQLEVFAGDNNVLLICDSRRATIRGLKNLLKHLEELPNPQKVLITNGVHEVGMHKNNVYIQIAPDIARSAGLVITYDKYLADCVGRDNTTTTVIRVNHVDELIYAARKNILPGAAVVIAGDLDPAIVAALRSEQ